MLLDERGTFAVLGDCDPGDVVQSAEHGLLLVTDESEDKTGRPADPDRRLVVTLDNGCILRVEVAAEVRRVAARLTYYTP